MRACMTSRCARACTGPRRGRGRGRSVDLFILADESGLTVSALRRQQDRAAWLYLLIGFTGSVTANVPHIDPAALYWTRYAVAAVPPVPDPVPAALNGTAERALELFGNQLAGGRVPSIRAIRSGLGVGQDRARSGTELPPHSDRRYTVTPIEVGLIVGVIVGLYVGFHGGHGHANYRHARARGGRPGLLVSLARGPYIRGSVPVGKGFRLTHKL
jgi:hypothetical protein